MSVIQDHSQVRQVLDNISLGTSPFKWSVTLHINTVEQHGFVVNDILLDSGADPDVITMDTVKQAGLTIIPAEKARMLKFGDGHEQAAIGTVKVTGSMTFTNITKEPYQFNETVFEVLPNSVASILIGVNTLKLMFPDNELLQCHNDNVCSRKVATLSNQNNLTDKQTQFYYSLFDNSFKIATVTRRDNRLKINRDGTNINKSTSSNLSAVAAKPVTQSDELQRALTQIDKESHSEAPNNRSAQAPDIQTILKAAKDKAVQTKQKVIPTDPQLLLLGYNVLPSLREVVTDLSHFIHTDELPPKALVHTPATLDDAQLKAHRTAMIHRAKSLLVFNEAITGFCNDPSAIVNINITDEDAHKCYTRQYPMPEALVPLVDEVIQNWKSKGLLEIAAIGTIINNAILAAPKKGDDGSWTALRVCMDFRTINKYMKNYDKYPIPRISDALARLRGKKYFGQLDLEWAYLQFPLDKESRKFTAFMWDGTQYQFKAAIFGLKHMPSHFQRNANAWFGSVVIVYIDNLIWGTDTIEEHERIFRTVIQIANSKNLKFKPQSIDILHLSLGILGHIVSEKGIAIDPSRVTDLLKWEQPLSGKDMHSKLGKLGFIRDHIRNYAELSAPFEKLKQQKDIIWTKPLIEQWNVLLQAFTKAPVLAHVNLEMQLCLACDASILGGGHVLFQVPKGCDKYEITKDNIIAISSHKFTETQLRYSIYKKELWSCIYGMRRHHNYLWGRQFVLITDHFPLIYIHTQPALSQALQQWLDVIQDYNFIVVHRPGILHVLPDVLSRLYNIVNRDVTAWGVYSNEQLLQAIDQHLMRGSDYDCVKSILEQKPPKDVVRKLTTTKTGGGRKQQSHKLRYTTKVDDTTKQQIIKSSGDHFADFNDDHVCTAQTVFTPTELKEIYTARHADCLTHSYLQHQDDINLESLESPMTQLDVHDRHREYYNNVYGTVATVMSKRIKQLQRKLTLSKAVMAEDEHSPDTAAEQADVKQESDADEPDDKEESQTDQQDDSLSTLTEEDKLRIACEKRNMVSPPSHERIPLIEQQHSLGHFGEKAIFRTLWNKKLWWPTIWTDIKSVIQNCRSCLQHTVTKSGWHPARALHAKLPGDVMYADIAQLPLARNGDKYLLVIVDAFTMYVILIALNNLEAETIARAFFQFWCDFGVYQVMHTDNASTFQNVILRALAHLMGCKTSFAVKYLPQTSPAEPVINNVKQRIVKTLEGCEKEWPLYYKAIQLYINMQVKEKHGSVPYSLMFGRIPNELTDYTKQALDLVDDNIAEWKAHQEKINSLIYPALDLRTGRFTQKYIERLNKLRQPLVMEALAPGTPVLVRDPLYINNNEHNRPLTTPPYLQNIHYVVNRVRNGAYLLRNETGELLDREVPLSQLKVLRARTLPTLGESDVYSVEKIVTRKGTSLKDATYRIRWKGYTANEDTWEPAKNILDKRMLSAYNDTHPFDE